MVGEPEAIAVSGREEIEVVGEMVILASRHYPFYQPTCLRRSLVLWYLLRRRGVPASLKLGVRATGGELEGHAWVEQDGHVVGDEPQIGQEYEPIDIPSLRRSGF